METKRKRCKECPWNKKNKIHKDWTGYVYSLVSKKTYPNIIHACHKIEDDTFVKRTMHNICIGSVEQHREDHKKKYRKSSFLILYWVKVFIKLKIK